MVTSRCSTVATCTSGADSGFAAAVFIVQPAVVSNTAAIGTSRAIQFFIWSPLSCCFCPRALFPALEVFDEVSGIHAPRHQLGALRFELPKQSLASLIDESHVI